jgi:hypothetical protein
MQRMSLEPQKLYPEKLVFLNKENVEAFEE